MPLPNIISGKTSRCSAACKATSTQCKNPAAFGCKTCRYHGARRPETVRRGVNHPQYRHGAETIEAKAERHMMSVFFHDAEDLMFALGMTALGSTRTRGRKPNISEG